MCYLMRQTSPEVVVLYLTCIVSYQLSFGTHTLVWSRKGSFCQSILGHFMGCGQVSHPIADVRFSLLTNNTDRLLQW